VIRKVLPENRFDCGSKPGRLCGVRVLLDLKPMRHRDFRYLWIGLFVTRLGTGITFVTVPYQVFKLTRSSMIVGLLGVAQIVPLVFSALLGGAFADAVDRRKLVRYSEIRVAVVTARGGSVVQFRIG
jgi:MFS family permease